MLTASRRLTKAYRLRYNALSAKMCSSSLRSRIAYLKYDTVGYAPIGYRRDEASWVSTNFLGSRYNNT